MSAMPASQPARDPLAECRTWQAHWQSGWALHDARMARQRKSKALRVRDRWRAAYAWRMARSYDANAARERFQESRHVL